MDEKRRTWDDLVQERPPDWANVALYMTEFEAELERVRIEEAEAARVEAREHVTFEWHTGDAGQRFCVPEGLWRLEIEDAFAVVVLPKRIPWPDPRRVVDLSLRSQRARTYETLLTHGDEGDLWRFVDGALLADLWDHIVLDDPIREAWEPLIVEARGRA